MNTQKSRDTLQLDKEERDILESFERGELQSVPHLEAEIQRHEGYARATLVNLKNKNKNINIRIAEYDLTRLKARAMGEGLSYQTYIASILHKILAK